MFGGKYYLEDIPGAIERLRDIVLKRDAEVTAEAHECTDDLDDKDVYHFEQTYWVNSKTGEVEDDEGNVVLEGF